MTDNDMPQLAKNQISLGALNQQKSANPEGFAEP